MEPGPELEQGGDTPDASRIVPLVGRRIPAMHLSSVDLPEPLCPSRPTVSPWSTCSVMSRSAQNSSCGIRPNRITRSLSDVALVAVELEMLADLVDLDHRAHAQISSAKLSSRRPKIQSATHSSTDDATITSRGCADTRAATRWAGSASAVCADGLGPVVQRALERDDHRCHGVEQVEARVGAHLVGDQLVRIHDRRHPEPREQRQLEQVLRVTERRR